MVVIETPKGSPALLTRMSIRPNFATAASTAAALGLAGGNRRSYEELDCAESPILNIRPHGDHGTTP